MVRLLVDFEIMDMKSILLGRKTFLESTDIFELTDSLRKQGRLLIGSRSVYENLHCPCK